MSFVRQLEAILFADIQGFTALMEQNETLALETRDRFQNSLEEFVARHQGRVVQFSGDGALCSFTSSVEAVRAAISLQLAMRKDPVIPLRIGINTGDVMVDGNKVYGDSVNIASRIESFAQTGTVLISGRVYDDIKNHKDIQTLSLGLYALKNVNSLTQIYAVINPGIQVPDPDTLEGKGEKGEKKCILVLPFVNLSRDPEQEYFSDGLTEELITGLTRLNGMRVISRTTSMSYKRNQKDIRTIATETGAGYIVEGSVRTNNSNLRITAQFIDALNDVHLWADNFTGTMDDIFDIQEQVAKKIVDELRLQLTGNEKTSMRKRYTENAEAYRLYLKGRHYWKKRTEEDLQTAVLYFQRAIGIDANYALAWTGLADTYGLMGEFGNSSRHALYPKIMDAIQKALQLDGKLAEAHISLAITLMLSDHDWVGAEKGFRKGLALDPNYPTAHHWFAEFLLFTGQTAEAFNEISLAVELDPLSQGILKDKGIFYYYNRQYKEALDVGLQTLQLSPGFIPAFRLLSLAYTELGEFDKAIEENNRWAGAIYNQVKSDVALAYIYAAAGRNDDAWELVHKLESQNMTGNDFRGMAIVYTALGETDTAFEWLEQSFDHHEEALCNIMVDPKLDPLRADPRFNGLLRKMGLEEFNKRYTNVQAQVTG